LNVFANFPPKRQTLLKSSFRLTVPSFTCFKLILLSAGGLSSRPSSAVCDACGEAVANGFAPLVPKLGLQCGSFSSASEYFTGIVQYLVDVCPNQALSGLRSAGVNLQPLSNWQNCPQDASNPQVVAQAQKACPNLSS